MFNKMSSPLTRQVVRLNPKQKMMTQQLSLDSRMTNPGPNAANDRALGRTVSGGARVGGSSGVSEEGKGGMPGKGSGAREGGRQGQLGTSGGGRETVVERGEREGSLQERGGREGGRTLAGEGDREGVVTVGRGREGEFGEVGKEVRGGMSGGKGGTFRGVFGGAGGGLGSDVGPGSNADLWMRSDSLYSPPVSPIPWLADYPGSGHLGKAPPGPGEPRSRRNGAISEETDRVRGKDGGGGGATTRSQVDRESLKSLDKGVHLAPARFGIRRTSSLGRIPDDLDEEEEEVEEVGTDQRNLKGSAGGGLNARRYRRQAICDVGLSSCTGNSSSVISVLADDITYEADDVDERKPGCLGSSSSQVPRRKRSSADLGVFYPGDLLSQAPPRRTDRPLFTRNTIANFANSKAYQVSLASLISEQDKKTKSSFSLLKLIDKKTNRSKDVVASDLIEPLHSLKRTKIPETTLERFKKAQWMDLVSEESRGRLSDLPKAERNRRSAAWELFTSECVFLIDFLLVLKHCFVEPLKQLQVEGHLMFVEPQNLFGNLDQICSVTLCFCMEFSRMLLEDINLRGNFCRTEVLIEGLKQLSHLSRDGEVYHDYCLNYSKAVSYLELLRKNDDFVEFEKWCEQDPRCNRLLLTDLLISPMQHCTKVPLMLNTICRYTENAPEQRQLMESLGKLESSLRDLDEKMKWLKSYERIQEIQQQIVWQPVTEFEPRIFIPECLRSLLNRQPCERLFSNLNRQLLHEGPLQLLEAVTRPLEMYVFLFDDILLITRVKKQAKKKTVSGSDTSHMSSTNQWTDGASLIVHRQPIALDRLRVHDLRPSPGDTQGTASCPRNSIVVLQFTRFQQIVSVYTLQAPTSEAKTTWLSRIRESKEIFRNRLDSNSRSPATSVPVVSNASSDNRNNDNGYRNEDNNQSRHNSKDNKDNKEDNDKEDNDKEDNDKEDNDKEDNDKEDNDKEDNDKEDNDKAGNGNDNDDDDDNNDNSDNEDNEYNDGMSKSSADDLRSLLTRTTTSSSSPSSLSSPTAGWAQSSLSRRHNLPHLSFSQQQNYARLYSAMRRPRSERRRHQSTPPSAGPESPNDVEDLTVQPSRTEDELEDLTEDDGLSETSSGETGCGLDSWMVDVDGGLGQPLFTSAVSVESTESTGNPDLDPGRVVKVSRSSADEELPVRERPDQTLSLNTSDAVFV